MRTVLVVTLFLLAASCMSQKSAESGTSESATAEQAAATSNDTNFQEPKFGTPVPADSDAIGDGFKKALFAGGCFWCLEPPFDKVDGVVATVSGYTDGPEDNPQYKQVASGRTGHTEAVLVVYDPDKVKYGDLVELFWRTHDPTDADGQFVDRGPQYRPGIFAYNAEQKKIATASRDGLEATKRFDKPIVVEILDADEFWPAEEYHQDFYKKDPSHYKRYRSGSGRDQFIDRVWNGS